MPNLPAYNPEAACPKCGGKDVAVRHCEDGGFWHATKLPHYGKDALHRDCQACHYEWLEAPLDRVKPVVDERAAIYYEIEIGGERYKVRRESWIDQLRRSGTGLSKPL